MNIISRKAYNTIMVDRLEGTGMNLVAIVRDVYIFVGCFTFITDFVVLEDIGEFVMSDMTDVLMGRPFRKITKLKYDVAKGLVSFTKIFDTYTYRMPRTIPRLKNFNWSKVPPLLDQLHFIEELVEIMEREVKCLKQICNLIVKVCWNSRRGPKFTWEREDQMHKNYPHLFANPEPSSNATS
ncbi:hypothetical protein Tco_0077891 [Tanacetum coccineum]